MHLDIIMRSCSRVASVHGVERPIGESKGELSLRCLSSLILSLNDWLSSGLSLKLTIIDDHSDAACLTAMQQKLASLAAPSTIIPLAPTGNRASLQAVYDFAAKTHGHLIYFVEDDYIHTRTAVREMVDAQTVVSAGFGQQVIVFPCDYPDRYDAPYPSLIFRSPERYWRTVRHSTATFLLNRETFLANLSTYQEFAAYNIARGITEDSTINRLYEHIPCLAPMPSLTVHLGSETLSPFVDWRRWWDEAATLPQAPVASAELGG